jgi:hypothetical protein
LFKIQKKINQANKKGNKLRRANDVRTSSNDRPGTGMPAAHSLGNRPAGPGVHASLLININTAKWKISQQVKKLTEMDTRTPKNEKKLFFKEI